MPALWVAAGTGLSSDQPLVSGSGQGLGTGGCGAWKGKFSSRCQRRAMRGGILHWPVLGVGYQRRAGALTASSGSSQCRRCRMLPAISPVLHFQVSLRLRARRWLRSRRWRLQSRLALPNPAELVEVSTAPARRDPGVRFVAAAASADSSIEVDQAWRWGWGLGAAERQTLRCSAGARGERGPAAGVP